VKKIISVVPSGNKVEETNLQPKIIAKKHSPKREFEISFSESTNTLYANDKTFSNTQGCFFDDVLEPRVSRKLIKQNPIATIDLPSKWNLDIIISICYIISKSSSKNTRLGEMKYASWITCFGDVPITRQISDDKTHRISKARAMRLIGHFNYRKREMVRAGKSDSQIAKWALTLVLDIMEGYRGFPKIDDPFVSGYHKNMIYGYKLLIDSPHYLQESTYIIDVTSIKVFVQKSSLMKFICEYMSNQKFLPIILLIYNDREKNPCYSFFANPYYPDFEKIDFTKLWEGLNRQKGYLGFETDLEGTAKSGMSGSDFLNVYKLHQIAGLISGYIFPEEFDPITHEPISTNP
jgi:hypothetical protein